MKTLGANYQIASLVIEELTRLGLRHIVISPGARSGPLALAAWKHEQITTHVVHDERSAAFFAAGLSKASKTPAVLICTSGTAAAHYLPAVIECSLTEIPLFIISADRPPELHFTGSNQTIPQDNLFSPFVVAQRTIPPPDHQNYLMQAVSETNWLVSQSRRGPVHLNMQFRQPLLGDTEDLPLPNRIVSWLKSSGPLTEHLCSVSPELLDNQVKVLLEQAARGLIVVGPIHCLEEQRAVSDFVAAAPWPCLCELAAGLSEGKKHIFLGGTKSVKHLEPDVILHFGGLPTDNSTRTLLECTEGAVVQIQSLTHKIDSAGFIKYRVEGSAKALASALLTCMKASSITQLVSDLRARKTTLLEEFCQEELSELSAVKHSLESLDVGHALYLANSLSVRLGNLTHGCKQGIPIGCHRGASGIDGTIALATGFCFELGRPTLLILGDIAFIHDFSSLQLAEKLLEPFVIVVLNNNGGGIFHLLPKLSELDGFEELFGTPHSVDLSKVSALFGLKHHKPKSPSELMLILGEALQTPAVSIVEVQTDRARNSRLMKDFSRRLSETSVVK